MKLKRRMAAILAVFGSLAACTVGWAQGGLDPRVEAVLDRIEAGGRDANSLSADLQYSVLQLLKANPDDPDEIQNFFGRVRFLREPEPARFYIHFEKWNDGNVWFKDQQEWFVFDGGWLIHANQRNKSVVKEQIARPDEDTDLFKLGRGPFPLPFGQKKSDILAQFDVRLEPTGSQDPPGTDRLVCVPRPGSESAERFAALELFVSNDAAVGPPGLPIKIIAENTKDATRQTVIFRNIRSNSGLRLDKDFRLPSMTRKWTVEEKPLVD